MALLRKAGSVSILVALALFGAVRIREVDFKNFDYPWGDKSGDAPGAPDPWQWLREKPGSTVRLVGGRHDFRLPDGLSDGYLLYRSVTFGDLDGDGQDEAAVDLLRGSGGTANWHYLYVFTLANGSPKLLGTLMSGSRANGGLVNVEIGRGILSLDFEDGDRSEGDCCSRGIIRVRYRFQKGRFIEVGRREKDSLRSVSYPFLYPRRPETVRPELNGRRNDIVYTDAEGNDIKLVTSGENSEPDLSFDKRSVVFLREIDQEHREIWTVETDGSRARPIYRGNVLWKGRICPSSTFRSPQWSVDGRSVYFVSDCTLMTGALWRLDVASGAIRPLISDAVLYGVIHTGRFKGYLLANRRTHPSAERPEPSYPIYLFYLFTPEGKAVQEVGDESGDLEELLAEWNRR